MGLFKLFAAFAAVVSAEEKSTKTAVITEHVYFQVQIGKNSKSLYTIVFGLFGEEVPKTAENFSMWCQGWSVEDQAVKKIADGGQGYEGSVFHRVIPDFMCQGGDFTNHNGTGGRGIKEEKWADENFNLKHDDTMLLSMANAGPNTNGSQFFITTAMTSWLDGKHVVFGKVVEGVSSIRKMEKQGSGSGKTSKTISIKHSGVAVKDGDSWKCKDRDVVLQSAEKKDEAQKEL